MKRLTIAVLLFPLLAAGCRAGTSAQLLAYDSIIASASEVRKAVDAYDATVRAETAKGEAEMLGALGRGIIELALQAKTTPDQAKQIAAGVVADMTKHLANYKEQERRRAQLYDATLDNLGYIISVAETGKQFVLYQSGISEQWKAYLTSQARAKLARTGE